MDQNERITAIAKRDAAQIADAMLKVKGHPRCAAAALLAVIESLLQDDDDEGRRIVALLAYETADRLSGLDPASAPTILESKH